MSDPTIRGGQIPQRLDINVEELFADPLIDVKVSEAAEAKRKGGALAKKGTKGPSKHDTGATAQAKLDRITRPTSSKPNGVKRFAKTAGGAIHITPRTEADMAHEAQVKARVLKKVPWLKELTGPQGPSSDELAKKAFGDAPEQKGVTGKD